MADGTDITQQQPATRLLEWGAIAFVGAGLGIAIASSLMGKKAGLNLLLAWAGGIGGAALGIGLGMTMWPPQAPPTLPPSSS